jgi:hypothetical protein
MRCKKEEVDFLINNLYLPMDFLLSLAKKGYLSAARECVGRGFYFCKNVYKLFCSENEDIFIFLRKKNVGCWSSSIFKKCSVRTFKLFLHYNKGASITRVFNKAIHYENRPLIKYLLNRFNFYDHFNIYSYKSSFLCGKSIQFLIYLLDLGIHYKDIIKNCYCSQFKIKCVKCKVIIKTGEANEINTAFLRAVTLEDIDNINYYIYCGATAFKKALELTRIRKIRSIIKLAMISSF